MWRGHVGNVQTHCLLTYTNTRIQVKNRKSINVSLHEQRALAIGNAVAEMCKFTVNLIDFPCGRSGVGVAVADE